MNLQQEQDPQNILRTHLQEIVKNKNFNYEQCLDWIINYNEKFGYITMACYIRIIEMKEFCRSMKDELLRCAIQKMNFSQYENFFSMNRDINELYQKIFMLMMVEQVVLYIHSLVPELTKDKKHVSFIVWEVIARYFIEEFYRLSPHDMQMNLKNVDDFTNKSKIYHFFLTKNIDLQDKINLYTQKKTFYESIIEYFYKQKRQSN